MADAIVVINAGSSSLKFSLFVVRAGDLALDVRGQIEGLYTAPRFVAKDGSGQPVAERTWAEGGKLGHDGAVEHLRAFLRERLADDRLVGVGHRVVHGGLEYAEPVRVDARVLKALERFVPLAPLHQPHNLSPIAALLDRAPDLPQVACFDTAFHRTNPDVAQRFALPAELHDAGFRVAAVEGMLKHFPLQRRLNRLRRLRMDGLARRLIAWLERLPGNRPSTWMLLCEKLPS